VVKSEENQLQPGFICVSGSETNKVCLMPSQAVNSVYHMIFRKKTAYSEPAILGFNDEIIIQKLLNKIRFRPIFINVGSSVVIVSEIGNKSFTSSILTKKSQRTLALQKMINNEFTLDFYKGNQILWHYKNKSANSHAIQENQENSSNSNLTYNPTTDKANLKILYELEYLQTDLEDLESSDNIITNHEIEQFAYLHLHEKLQ
ncbi:2453_t:CDS:2, partial [Racocetra persica]